MARTNSRVVLNRSKLDEVTLAMADGMQEVGRLIVIAAEPLLPDDPRTPHKIAGDAGTWVNGRKVAGTAKKPRAASVKDAPVVTLVGWDFPARFNDRGTIHQPARPFAEPAERLVTGHVQDIMARIVGPKLGKNL